MYLIYKFENKVTGKVYIGRTNQKLHKRVSYHFNESKKKSIKNKFKNALRKYSSIETWDVTVLEENLSLEEANYLESVYVEKFNSYKRGYNSTLGGDGCTGNKHSIETLEKMKRHAELRFSTEKGKEHLRYAGSRGKGRKFTDSHRDKISQSLKGHIVNETTKQKIRDKIKGTKLSIETKEKLREVRRGKSYERLYGEEKANILKKKRSVSMKKNRKYLRGNKKKWKVTDPNGDIFVVDDLVKFSSIHNLDPAGLRRTANGVTKQYKRWKVCKI